jgi:RNA polymerase sigma factor (sigma-70 family)
MKAKAAHRLTMASLYVEQKGFVEGVVRRGGVPSRDVEDVTHDAFIQIGGALSRFDPGRGEGLRAWLGTIARRTARDHLALGRTSEMPIGFDVEEDGAMVDERTAEAMLLDAEERAYLRHVVGQGDEVLARVVYGEQNWAEIAADLGISIATVQSRLRRAHAVLGARLRRRRAAGRYSPPR